MLCENCGKEEAKVTFKEMTGNEMTEFHLCEACAKRKGLGEILSKIQETATSLVTGLMGGVTQKSVAEDNLTCPQCHLTYREFKKVARLGCSTCYDLFSEELLPLMRRIHGSTSHVGKIPSSLDKRSRVRREIKRLRDALRQAIAQEEFERAAELRDELKKVES
jgi:protein arginine kinase activator